MNILKIAGKFLDQPLLVAKFQKSVPAILLTSSGLYGIRRIKREPEKNRNSAAARIATTIMFTAASALAAPIITNKLFKKAPVSIKRIKESNSSLVNEFIKNTSVDNTVRDILHKSKDKVLSISEVKKMYETITDNNFLNKLIPGPENITSKEIFSEIGRLSIFGLIPVLGGICGGIIGDVLSTKKWKEKIPDKIKEGAYQYLANIFLCNAGAGIALGIMEKSGVKSKWGRALGMVGGIVTTGILGGSAIANLIGNKIINPIFAQKCENKIYAERHPEALDIGLHTDDIATVAVMSGLKWIEPALPLMYAISGYRAGIGYRNGNVKDCNKINKS